MKGCMFTGFPKSRMTAIAATTVLASMHKLAFIVAGLADHLHIGVVITTTVALLAQVVD
jgi:hypothetical protein